MSRPPLHTACTVPDCGQPHYGLGLCRAHYKRDLRRRGPTPRPAPPAAGCCALAAGAPSQECAVCRRRLCPTCYGDWRGLACQDCQAQARRSTADGPAA